jgi:hypothetical protein
MIEGKPTRSPPILYQGVRFFCVRTGIGLHEWRSEDGRLRIGRLGGSLSYFVMIDDVAIKGADPQKAKRFQTLTEALSAGAQRVNQPTK